MKKIVLFVLVVSVFFVSCNHTIVSDEDLKEGKGGVYYGGVFRTNGNEDFRTLYPLSINEDVSLHITSMIYEGLVKLNQSDLSIQPCLAEKWQKSADAKVWTFTIRPGVRFHDNACFSGGKGREINANDFKYCFDRLCEASTENQQYSITFKDRVEGATEYYESTTKKKPIPGGVSGVKVIDEHTLQITLKYSFSGFLNVLTMPGCWLYPKEAIEKYGTDIRVNCVGTGAFQLKSFKEGEPVYLERNDNYWAFDDKGNQLPFLKAVKFSIIKDKKNEIAEFKKGNLDMVFGLPTEMIPDVLDELNHAKEGNAKFEVQRVPAMGIEYYGFQIQNEVFHKKEVRLAFNYAIDRERLITFTRQGDGIPATYGIVPPSFPGYENKGLKGYKFNPDTAKKLLAKAGFPNGQGFPKTTLEINSGGEQNAKVAESIKKMLKDNLNIEVEINVLPFAEHMEKYESGKSLFWRTSWIADYPDPESFLTVLYGKHVPADLTQRSFINTSRYQSRKFDSIFELALREVDPKKRYGLYMEADQVQLSDGAVLPIYYHENYRLIQQWVKNFEANPLEYRDMTQVYFIPKNSIKKK